jgi:hypothetical protein
MLKEVECPMSNDDVVVLDGHSTGPTWPVEEAEALLADPTPWGLDFLYAGGLGQLFSPT